VAGFYRHAVEEELLAHSPAAHVRRPRLAYESHAIGLGRNELGALLVAVGLGSPAKHALISLLALNGLRVSEATGAGIEALGVERGHRTLVITARAAMSSLSRWRHPAGALVAPRFGCGVQRLHPVSPVIHSSYGVRRLHPVSRVAGIRAGGRRDPGAQARELMPQRRNVGLGQVVADQAEVQVPALGRQSTRLIRAATTSGPQGRTIPQPQPIQARAH
jgi:integrase